jgi:hypothetical protein
MAGRHVLSDAESFNDTRTDRNRLPSVAEETKMEQIRKIPLSALFIGLGVFLIYASLQISVRDAHPLVSPRAVPITLSSIMTILAVAILIGDLRKGEGPARRLDLGAIKAIAGFLVLVLVYVLLLGTINFHALTLVFLVAAFFYFGIRSPLWAGVAAGCLVAAEFLVFQLGFKVMFP